VPIGLPGVRGDSGATGTQGIQGPKGNSADPAELSALKDQIFDLKNQNSILMEVVNALRFAVEVFRSLMRYEIIAQ
jgi:hypothetical protein